MNVAKHGTFGEAVARAELVGVTYRGVGAVTRAKVRLVLQSTDLTRVLDVMLRGWVVGMDFTKWW